MDVSLQLEQKVRLKMVYFSHWELMIQKNTFVALPFH